MKITKKMEKQYTKDLFEKIKVTLAKKGLIVKTVKQLEPFLIGGVRMVTVGRDTTWYLNEDKLLSYTSLRIEDNKPVFDYTDYES